MQVDDKRKLRVKMLKQDLGRKVGDVFYASRESAEVLVKDKVAEYVDQPPKPRAPKKKKVTPAPTLGKGGAK